MKRKKVEGYSVRDGLSSIGREIYLQLGEKEGEGVSGRERMMDRCDIRERMRRYF